MHAWVTLSFLNYFQSYEAPEEIFFRVVYLLLVRGGFLSRVLDLRDHLMRNFLCSAYPDYYIHLLRVSSALWEAAIIVVLEIRTCLKIFWSREYGAVSPNKY
jgi:hypothetical protein